ncbi:MAG: site-specific DNA-methyltransferase [Gammaproteobacteria bacterium]|nr:site-specific DNA-methyltransferase [Gammaproteobacteria bacterium]MBU1645220.1 site-specific DNA-methyltransferase [Gammaproteobacteria bacterium]MBU1973255.1 site-specific DNA-methyltransferase [Gammaproteobacteria bacterium]
MPFLDWVNKAQAQRATADVPYHLLEFQSAHGDADAENLLIQGDNLLALKALLPFYRGQVKCIFIDPPYNTQSAFGQFYDDKLEHSQWLSMIYPRLDMLRDLLAEDGSIWVTIDDNEGHYLKVLMDEVFSRDRFVTTVAWQSRYSRSSDTAISLSHNFIHCYASNPNSWKTVRNRLHRTPEQEKQFSNPDNDPRGPWRAIPWDAPNIRENLSYPITTPSGKVRYPPPGRCWSRTEEQWNEIVSAGLAYFGKKGDGAPSFRQYLSDSPPIVPNTWWAHEDAGHTDEAKKEVVELFGQKAAFATPKPERLLQRIIHIATTPGDLVLDSFLGSGTTAAVAHKMGRRYIGIEMGEHARTHCLPRLQKVIDGEQGGISKAVNWQGGGGFRFHTLGEPVFDADGGIHPAVRFAALAAYLWHFETGEPARQAFDSPLLGIHQGTAYYLLYNGILGDRRPAGGNVLTAKVLTHLDALFPHAGPRIIYGETTWQGEARLREAGIAFKQIPYDIKAR